MFLSAFKKTTILDSKVLEEENSQAKVWDS